MLREHGYVFACKIVAAIDRIVETSGDSGTMLALAEARVHARSAAGISWNRDSRARYDWKIRSAYRRHLRDLVKALEGNELTNTTTKDRPSSFAQTVKWLVDSFFAAPGDEERDIIANLVASKLALQAELEGTHWY